MNILRRLFYLFILSFITTACGGARISDASPVKLRFLDEYIIPKDLKVDENLVGGLSDLDYDGAYFYTVSDIPRNPMIYKMSIEIEENRISKVDFIKGIRIQNRTESTKKLAIDSEGINYNPENNSFTVSSEGSIRSKLDPFIVDIDSTGNVLDFYKIPEYFFASNEKGLRNNGVFEGLTHSVNQQGIWVATELPMISDGPKPKLYKTNSPVRFTYFNRDSKEPEKQFAYNLGRIRKAPLLPFAINGVSGILEIAPNQFLVIERAFSAGHSNRGNRVLIFLADGKNATNTLDEYSLKSKIGKSIISAQKHLIFDFNSTRKKLKKNFIDNIEGISWGPTLPNGNKTIVLISDNNFNVFNEQINQVILMEIVESTISKR